MATIKFLLQSQSDNSPIYLRLSINRANSIKRKIGLFINSNDWSKSAGFPKENNTDNKNLKTDLKDWSEQIKFENIKSKDSTHQFLAFGWGDKGFYLDTPEWSDLKFSTAFKAAFNLGTSAMHTTFYKQIQENESCVKIEISKDQYQKLITFIEASFQYDTNGNPIFIEATTYGKNDSFYEAHRTYNLFYTCNTWANQALKKADMKAAFWTPTDKGIFYHYQ